MDTQVHGEAAGRSRLLAALSPLVLMAVCIPAQHVAGARLGVWAWVPTMLLFWTTIAIAVNWFGGRRALARWLQPAQGAMLWGALGVGVGLLSLPGFLAHWQIVREPSILVFWLAFGLINPWFEEAYWRGMLMDATASWGGLLSVVYSAAWFALSHPLIWGVHATAMRQWPVIAALFFVGVIWAVVYRRSKSIRWTIAGHMLANLLGMAVPVLLNLYDPAAR
ncbi:CPBP family intramembrane glutamic endopeptidase [Lysobacter sp. CFH 32150]|uniref:CPBP family intramembrane glutamic endopeptidase n=1 Tax=Lysobacter sp. CFH 32150 TaxID=2927128 RepID=UPI001FA7AD02|nr:CPBP family intramembrane glutamic endopeptidase [Lysobacter sp. CFH 32150]MCI4568029.1 CPBP family intramembrane metalloprotease [Lysobacter sp. CFH 32150]